MLFVATVLAWESQGGKLGECTVRRVRKFLNEKGLLSAAAATLSRRAWAERLADWDVVASKGWNKHVYTPDEIAHRLFVSAHFRFKTPAFWNDVVFTDEHIVPHVDPKQRDAFLAMKRGHTYKEKDQPLSAEHAIPRGKSVKYGLSPPPNHVAALSGKFCVGIMGDRVLTYRSCQSYVQFGGPPPPRPPQPLSKNGIPLGRKRKAENETTTEKAGSFCARHWGDFLCEVADAARKARGWGPKHRVLVYQDNVAFHYAPAALEAAERAKVDFVGGLEKTQFRPPPYSPDLNMVEKIFSQADTWLVEQEVLEPAGKREETNRRFEHYCRAVASASAVSKITGRMQHQCRLVFAAEGGPSNG